MSTHPKTSIGPADRTHATRRPFLPSLLDTRALGPRHACRGDRSSCGIASPLPAGPRRSSGSPSHRPPTLTLRVGVVRKGAKSAGQEGGRRQAGGADSKLGRTPPRTDTAWRRVASADVVYE